MPEASTKSAKKKVETRSVKRMCSFPHALFKFAREEATRIAREEGRERANISGYLARLIFQAKITRETKR